MIRRVRSLGLAAALVVPSLARQAGALEPRDYALNPPRPGTYALLDLYTVGAQASLENRADLEPGMSMLTTRATGTLSYPFAEASAHADVRVFLFTLGASGAYRQVYRNLTFAPGEDSGIEARRARDKAKDFNSQGYGWYEGRLRLTMPLDSFFWVHTGTVRYEGARDRSFDFFHATMHDEGVIYKYESNLFFRHRDFGTVGPAFRYMDLPRSDAEGNPVREGEIDFGLVLTTRPGLVRARGGNVDLLLVSLLFSTTKQFGMHGYQDAIPFYPLVVYRAALSL